MCVAFLKKKGRKSESGHQKNKWKNKERKGVEFCHNRDKHRELCSEIQDLKTVVKELENKQQKSKTEFDVFKAARERAASSFFGVVQPWLNKQNTIKYVDRNALDRDHMTLKEALANKNCAKRSFKLGTAWYYWTI